jgi:hypothetical protein
MEYNDEIKAFEMAKFQVRREITMLFKRFLETIEVIGDTHQEGIEKLKINLPIEYKKYVDLADYFTEARENAVRKMILDAGNDCIRNIENDLKQFKITFK